MLTTKISLPTKDQALPGRNEEIKIINKHYVHGLPLKEPYADNSADLETIYFGLGCFWGAERKYWQTHGVVTTAVGYMAGFTPNPLYEEICSGLTGHNEVVKVVYKPSVISVESLLKIFFESHNPTQGMRQGNDRGTQYRSGVYTTRNDQLQVALDLRTAYQKELHSKGFGDITTEIMKAPVFYFAENYHQQYLAKNPNGYCNIGGIGVACPV